MTGKRRRTTKEIAHIKLLLADIIQDVFDNNGQFISHDELARRHVLRNQSTRAAEEVARYGGLAVVYLRSEGLDYAIVPVTAAIHDWQGDTDDEEQIANTVAGLGAGGSRVGWYHPASKDDWLWIYFVGHLARSGMHAVYHALEQDHRNPALLSARGRAMLTGRALVKLPKPPREAEKQVLEARIQPAESAQRR